MTKISVVLPVYNVEEYITQCIESLVSQTLKDIEIIFIDDKGNDKSVEIIKKYAQKDNRIKILYNKKNKGVAYSRNLGIDYATGEFISFVDPDDWIDCDFYEKLYQQAKKENADISIGNYCIHHNDKEKNVHNIEQIKRILKQKKFIGIAYTWGFVLSIYRTNFLKNNKIRFPQLTNGEDIVFLIEALSSTKQIAYDFTVKYHYIQHENSASTKYSLQRLHHIILHYNMIINILEKNKILRADYVEYISKNILLPVKDYWLNFIKTKGTLEDASIFMREVCKLFENVKYQNDFRDYLAIDYFNNLKDKKIKNLVTEQLLRKQTKIYLFNFIPLYKIKRKNNKSTHYLFGVIPLFKVREK